MEWSLAVFKILNLLSTSSNVTLKKKKSNVKEQGCFFFSTIPKKKKENVRLGFIWPWRPH